MISDQIKDTLVDHMIKGLIGQGTEGLKPVLELLFNTAMKVESEAEVHWRDYFKHLQSRGLRGLRLIVSDDHAGMKAARMAVFPSVPWQRC